MGLKRSGTCWSHESGSGGSVAAETIEAEDDSEPHPFIDPAAFRFSIKLGAAITLGLLVGLTTQRADLQTILWSIVVAGQPNQVWGGGPEDRSAPCRMRRGRTRGACRDDHRVAELRLAAAVPRRDFRRDHVFHLRGPER